MSRVMGIDDGLGVGDAIRSAPVNGGRSGRRTPPEGEAAEPMDGIGFGDGAYLLPDASTHEVARVLSQLIQDVEHFESLIESEQRRVLSKRQGKAPGSQTLAVGLGRVTVGGQHIQARARTALRELRRASRALDSSEATPKPEIARSHTGHLSWTRS